MNALPLAEGNSSKEKKLTNKRYQTLNSLNKETNDEHYWRFARRVLVKVSSAIMGKLGPQEKKIHVKELTNSNYAVIPDYTCSVDTTRLQRNENKYV